MCKRYIIEARRNASEEWSTWTETDDLYSIQKHYDRVKELGYEVRAIDPKIEAWEKEHREGTLLFAPVKVGQKVWAVIPEDSADIHQVHYTIEEWEVEAIIFNGKKWYAGDGCGTEFEVRSKWCLLSKASATKLAKELNGEDDEE